MDEAPPHRNSWFLPMTRLTKRLTRYKFLSIIMDGHCLLCTLWNNDATLDVVLLVKCSICGDLLTVPIRVRGIV
uniref:Uncharacterized protein n=1 Tax=Megaselia scalaris TaxID=36166 RepID=T1GC55_MEGSC